MKDSGSVLVRFVVARLVFASAQFACVQSAVASFLRLFPMH